MIAASRQFVTSLFSANALGIARGAIDSLVEIASLRATTRSPLLLKDRPEVQASLGQAEAILGAARSFAVDSLARFWDALIKQQADLIRATMVYHRAGEGWLGVHSHLSLNRGVPQTSHGNRPVKAQQ